MQGRFKAVFIWGFNWDGLASDLFPIGDDDMSI